MIPNKTINEKVGKDLKYREETLMTHIKGYMTFLVNARCMRPSCEHPGELLVPVCLSALLWFWVFIIIIIIILRFIAHTFCTFLFAFCFTFFFSCHLEPIIRPTSQLQNTGLNVVREILDVDGAGRLIDGGGLPHNQSVVVDGGLGHESHLVVPVGTETHSCWATLALDAGRGKGKGRGAG